MPMKILPQTPLPTEITRRARHRAAAERVLTHADASTRLKGAMAAGTHPDPELLDLLVTRGAVEDDFNVREMLVWALLSLPAALTVPRMVDQLDDPRPQARAQALHALSKIGDKSAWPAITQTHLDDPDLQVARSAWRAAAALVPAGGEPELAQQLARHLGRGDHDTQRGLSLSFFALGVAAKPALQAMVDHEHPAVAAHAGASLELLVELG